MYYTETIYIFYPLKGRIIILEGPKLSSINDYNNYLKIVEWIGPDKHATKEEDQSIAISAWRTKHNCPGGKFFFVFFL